MNESKFIALYMEITSCSVDRARSVYMVISEQPEMPGSAVRGREVRGIAPAAPWSFPADRAGVGRDLQP